MYLEKVKLVVIVISRKIYIRTRAKTKVLFNHGELILIKC